MFKKVIVFICFFLGVGLSYARYNINFNWLPGSFQKKLVWVHFQWWWNNFWWMFFVTEEKKIQKQVNIILGGKKILNCKMQLKWYYYNWLHWQILYPLDKWTRSFWANLAPEYYSWLTITWWFYTLCNNDIHSIYGQIIYKFKNKKLFTLQVWLKYNTDKNEVIFDFARNFQVIQWKILGLIYDSVYWLWFIWWKVVWWNEKFNELVNVLNDTELKTMVISDLNKKEDIILSKWSKTFRIIPEYWISLISKLFTLWLMNIWRNWQNISDWIVWNFTQNLSSKHTIFTNMKNVTISKVLNLAKKNAEILCRWKRSKKYGVVNINNVSNKIMCIQWDNLTININEDLTINNQKTYIIVKWNINKVIFKKSQTWEWNINVFVNNWYVLFDNKINLQTVWYTSWAVFKWNIIVNWLIWWSEKWDFSVFNHKLYLYGSLISLNKIVENYSTKKYLTRLLWKNINNLYLITEVFWWRCLDRWKWIDWVDCSNLNEKYNFYSLITIKKNYKNILIDNSN